MLSPKNQTTAIRTLLLFVIALLVLLFLKQNTINKQEETIADFKELQKYHNAQIDSFKNKLGEAVVEVEVAKVHKNKVIKRLSDEVFNLKKKEEKQIKAYHALLRVKQKVVIKEVFIPYFETDTLYVTPDSNGKVPADSVVIPPKKFRDSTKHYDISGTVLLKGVRINSISFTDTVSLRIVDKKEGFFKRRKTVIQGIHSNPLFSTEKIQTVIRRGEKPSRWQKWIKPLLVGAAASYLTYKVVK